MIPVQLPVRALAALLAVALSLPSPALAFRPTIEGKTLAGLEERLGTPASGAPPTRELRGRRLFLQECAMMGMAALFGGPVESEEPPAVKSAREAAREKIRQSNEEGWPPLYRVADDAMLVQKAKPILTLWRTMDDEWRTLAGSRALPRAVLRDRLQARQAQFYRELTAWLPSPPDGGFPAYSPTALEGLLLTHLPSYLASIGVDAGAGDASVVQAPDGEAPLVHYVISKSVYRVLDVGLASGRILGDAVLSHPVITVRRWPAGDPQHPAFLTLGFSHRGAVFIDDEAVTRVLAWRQAERTQFRDKGWLLLLKSVDFWNAVESFPIPDLSAAVEVCVATLASRAAPGTDLRVEMVQEVVSHERQHLADQRSPELGLQHIRRKAAQGDVEALDQLEFRAHLNALMRTPRIALMNIVSFGGASAARPSDRVHRPLFEAMVDELEQHPGLYGIELRPHLTIKRRWQVMGQLYRLADLSHPERLDRLLRVLQSTLLEKPSAPPVSAPSKSGSAAGLEEDYVALEQLGKIDLTPFEHPDIPPSVEDGWRIRTQQADHVAAILRYVASVDQALAPRGGSQGAGIKVLNVGSGFNPIELEGYDVVNIDPSPAYRSLERYVTETHLESRTISDFTRDAAHHLTEQASAVLLINMGKYLSGPHASSETEFFQSVWNSVNASGWVLLVNTPTVSGRDVTPLDQVYRALQETVDPKSISRILVFSRDQSLGNALAIAVQKLKEPVADLPERGSATPAQSQGGLEERVVQLQKLAGEVWPGPRAETTEEIDGKTFRVVRGQDYILAGRFLFIDKEEWQQQHERFLGYEDLVVVTRMQRGLLTNRAHFLYADHTLLSVLMLQAHQDLLKDEIVLDAGSGDGILAAVASRLGAKHVFGVEGDAWWVDESRNLLGINQVGNAEVIQADFADIGKVSRIKDVGVVMASLRNSGLYFSDRNGRETAVETNAADLKNRHPFLAQEVAAPWYFLLGADTVNDLADWAKGLMETEGWQLIGRHDFPGIKSRPVAFVFERQPIPGTRTRAAGLEEERSSAVAAWGAARTVLPGRPMAAAGQVLVVGESGLLDLVPAAVLGELPVAVTVGGPAAAGLEALLARLPEPKGPYAIGPAAAARFLQEYPPAQQVIITSRAQLLALVGLEQGAPPAVVDALEATRTFLDLAA